MKANKRKHFAELFNPDGGGGGATASEWKEKGRLKRLRSSSRHFWNGGGKGHRVVYFVSDFGLQSGE